MTIAPDIPRLDSTKPIGPQLVNALRRRIIHNDWKPGQRLSESEVAADYDVSRQPIREAFIKLREDGLIEVRPQRGSFVRKISSANVLDARFVREAIEADIVRIVASAPKDDVIRDLEELVAAQKRAADSKVEEFMAIDDRFHHRLALAAGHVHAWETVESTKSQLDRVRHLSSQHFPRANVIAQHIGIVDAIKAGSPDQAEADMRQHLRGLIRDLPTIKETFADFFE